MIKLTRITGHPGRAGYENALQKSASNFLEYVKAGFYPTPCSPRIEAHDPGRRVRARNAAEADSRPIRTRPTTAEERPLHGRHGADIRSAFASSQSSSTSRTRLPQPHRAERERLGYSSSARSSRADLVDKIKGVKTESRISLGRPWRRDHRAGEVV